MSLAVQCEFVVDSESAKTRLDIVIASYFSELADDSGAAHTCEVVPTRSKIASWIGAGYVCVDAKVIEKTSFCPDEGAVVTVKVPEPAVISLEPDPQVLIDVIFEDEHLIVLNKPAGLVVHPGAGTTESTLVHGLLAHLGDSIKQVGDALRPGIVHRLDKDTSGIMVVAKTDRAYQALVSQFAPPRTISRKYIAVTQKLPGISAKERVADDYVGEIDLPIGRHPVDRKKMAVRDEGGKSSQTCWRIRKVLSQGYLLELELKTGRTHQIRVHLKHLLAPIVGDAVYGPSYSSYPRDLQAAVKKLSRQALHAETLSFMHPITTGQMTFSAAISNDITELLESME